MGEPNTNAQVDFVEEVTQFSGREWVFQRIAGWVGNPTSEQFFLITGRPGSGKSAIARRIAQFSSGTLSGCDSFGLPKRFLNAVHYCSTRRVTSLDAVSFVRSISLQLAASDAKFAQALISSNDPTVQVHVRQEVREGNNVIGVVIENLHIAEVSPIKAFAAAVIQPCKAVLADANGDPSKWIIMVDGLDESLLVRDTTILDLLSKVDGLESALRFVVTSRPKTRVSAEIKNRLPLRLSDKEGERRSKKELSEYVFHRLTKLQLPAVQGSLEGITNVIAAKASDNFLYARLLLDDLAAGRRSIASLATLPVGLDGFYYDSIQRALLQDNGNWNDDYASIVGVVSVSQEPLTRPQMQRFSGLSTSKITKCLRAFESLIERAKNSNKQDAIVSVPDSGYSLFHESMREFLIQEQLTLNEEQIDNPFFLDPVEWNNLVSSFYEQQNSWDVIEWSKCDDYGLRHLAGHLIGANRTQEVPLLIKPKFLAAKANRFHDFREINSDLMLVMWAADLSKDLRATAQAAILICGLRISASSDSYKPLIPLYGLAGELERAIDLIELNPTAWSRATNFRALVATLSAVDPKQAWAVAERVDDLWGRCECMVLTYKAFFRRDQSFDANRTYLDCIMTLLNSSAGHAWPSLLYWELSEEHRTTSASVAEELFQKSLDLAQAVDNPKDQYVALLRLARSLAHTIANEALVIYDEALHALDRSTWHTWRDPQYEVAIGEMALIDVEHAITRARQITDPTPRGRALLKCANFMASTQNHSLSKALLNEAMAAFDAESSVNPESVSDAQRVSEIRLNAQREIEQLATRKKILSPISPELPELNPRKVEQIPKLAKAELEHQLKELVDCDPEAQEVADLIYLAASSGHRTSAVSVIQEIARRLPREVDESWKASAWSVLLSAIAKVEFDLAVEMSNRAPNTGVAIASIISETSSLDLRRALSLFDSHHLEISDKIDAITSIVVASARTGDIEVLCRSLGILLSIIPVIKTGEIVCASPSDAITRLVEFRDKTGPFRYSDLVCETLIEASGLLSPHSLNFAKAMFEAALGHPRGDPKFGEAIVHFYSTDQTLALKLLESVRLAYEDDTTPDAALCVANAARGAAQFAPNIALAAMHAFDRHYPSIGASVYSAAAKFHARSNPKLAEQLLGEAITRSRETNLRWLRADALLGIARDSSTWNVAVTIELINEVVNFVRSNSTTVSVTPVLSHAAAIVNSIGDEPRAQSLLVESIRSIGGSDADPLSAKRGIETLFEIANEFSEDTAIVIFQGVVRSVIALSTASPNFCPLYEWIDVILSGFVRTAGHEAAELAQLLINDIENTDTAMDQIFFG